jgi:hypothetical protein
MNKSGPVLSPEASAFMDKLLDSRGAILSSFAQVEWFLAKLIVEAGKFKEYAELDLSFSQDAERRADRLRKVLDTEGPFSPYANDLLNCLDIVIKYVGLRTMAAHGLTVRPDSFLLNSVIHFRLYRMYKGGNLVEEKSDLTIKQYTEQASELSAAAREFIKVVRRIWADLKLDHLDPEA